MQGEYNVELPLIVVKKKRDLVGLCRGNALLNYLSIAHLRDER